MKKSLLAVLLVICMITCVTGCGAVSTNTYSVDDMKKLVSDVYEKVGENNLPRLQTFEVDSSSVTAVTIYTGLLSTEGIEYIVESEPISSADAYSFVLIKTNGDANIEEMKQNIVDNIDMTAIGSGNLENVKLYVNNYDSIIAIVMASENWADPVYKEFSSIASNKLGKVLEKNI